MLTCVARKVSATFRAASATSASASEVKDAIALFRRSRSATSSGSLTVLFIVGRRLANFIRTLGTASPVPSRQASKKNSLKNLQHPASDEPWCSGDQQLQCALREAGGSQARSTSTTLV